MASECDSCRTPSRGSARFRLTAYHMRCAGLVRWLLVFSLLSPALAQAHRFDVRIFGAKCDGVTDDSTAIQTAITAAVAAHGEVYIPSGTCVLLNGLVANGSYWGMVGESVSATLAYRGSTPIQAVLWLQGTGSAIYEGVRIEHLAIDGNSNSVNALQVDATDRSSFRDLRLGNVTGAGYYGRFDVLDILDQVATSIYEGAWSQRPSSCIVLDSLPTGTFSNSNTIIDPICEGVGGTGIVLQNASDTLILGGSSEANYAGLEISAPQSNLNTVVGLDFETNQAFDVLVSGNLNNLIGLVSLLSVSVTGRDNMLTGGAYNSINIGSSASYTTLGSLSYGNNGGAVTDDSLTTLRRSPIANAAKGGAVDAPPRRAVNMQLEPEGWTDTSRSDLDPGRKAPPGDTDSFGLPMKYEGTLTTTAGDSDSLRLPWRDGAPRFCFPIAGNHIASEMTRVHLTWRPGKVTVFHPGTAGARFGIVCANNPKLHR